MVRSRSRLGMKGSKLLGTPLIIAAIVLWKAPARRYINGPCGPGLLWCGEIYLYVFPRLGADGYGRGRLGGRCRRQNGGGRLPFQWAYLNAAVDPGPLTGRKPPERDKTSCRRFIKGAIRIVGGQFLAVKRLRSGTANDDTRPLV